MDTVKFKKRNVKVIAHRGLSGIEAENTNAAFVAAANRSYCGIETDVHKTLDGVFVVIHDDDTSRISDENIVIEENTYAELQKINIKDTDSSLRCDLKIPTFGEYLRICSRYGKMAVVELKNSFCADDIKKIIAVVKAHCYLKNTVFISFDFDNLVSLRKELPDQKVQFLTKNFSDELLSKLTEHNFDIDIYYKSLTKEIIKKLKANNLEINCWTCNDKKCGEKLAALGADYITTNILE